MNILYTMRSSISLFRLDRNTLLKIQTKIDLLLLNLLNIILIAIIVFWPSSLLRVILGMPFILFFPGYATISALYPTKDTISSTHRLMLSFALSIAIVPLILLLLNFTSWGIRLNPILYSVAAFTAIVSVIAWLRRKSKPKSDRFNVEFDMAVPVWKGFWKAGTANKIISVILVLAILGAIGTLIYVIRMPDTAEKYTEFYILNTNGKATNYPQTLTLGEEGKIIVGIVNHERATISYHVEVITNGVKDYETSSISLANGEKWENEVTFTPTILGTNQEVEFLLFKGGETTSAMEPLHLWMDVTQ